MAACDTIHFNNITSDVFANVARQLASKGFALTGPQGTVNGPFGIVIEYQWNEQAQTLAIDVVEKSFFVSCAQIREQLTSALGQP